MKWVVDLDEDDNTQLAMSGEVAVGDVHQSGSGRWRWAIVMLPGLSRYRDDLRGWKETEVEAKVAVEEMFSAWCEKAGLSAEVR